MANPDVEVVDQPLTLWVAAVGTAFPAVDAAPASPWTKVGSSGDLNYGQDGVLVSHRGEHVPLVPFGRKGPTAVERRSDEWRVSVRLNDMSLEQYAKVVGLPEPEIVEAGPGTCGYRTLDFARGIGEVQTMALLIRGTGASPYGEGFNFQYEVPIAAPVSGSIDTRFQKGEAAGLNVLEWLALVDENGVPVRRVDQDSEAES
jgi:hypothetical protein